MPPRPPRNRARAGNLARQVGYAYHRFKASDVPFCARCDSDPLNVLCALCVLRGGHMRASPLDQDSFAICSVQ